MTKITEEAMDADYKTKVLVKETVRETLLAMGFNVTDPDEMIAHQKDQAYLRSARLTKEAMLKDTGQHFINVIVSGLVSALFSAATIIYFMLQVR